MPNREHTDLVLVNPGNRTQTYQSLGRSLSAVEPPVWAGLFATFVRRHGFSVSIVDAGAEGLDAEAAARRIAERRPLLVAVVVYGHQPSASTQVMPGASALCAALKDHAPEAKVLLAGGHVAALPERTLREEAADFVANGEGLYTLVDLLQALKARATAMTGVRDLWYREGDAVCFTSPAPLLQGLDEALPGVAWDLLPMTKYRAHNWHCFGGCPGSRTPRSTQLWGAPTTVASAAFTRRSRAGSARSAGGSRPTATASGAPPPLSARSTRSFRNTEFETSRSQTRCSC